MNLRERLGTSAAVIVVLLFFGLFVTAIVSGIVSHFTCDWISQSSWVTWSGQCTAARVGTIAMFGILGMIILGISIALITVIVVFLIKAGFFSCCSHRPDYLHV
jgi:hypothetical protein